MTQNYQQIIDALTMFASAHPNVQRFKSSFFEQIDPFTSSENTYPILYAVPQNIILNQNTNTYSFRLYCLDILLKDRSNQAPILLATSEILRDLVNWLRDIDNPLNIINNPVLTSVNNFGVDFSSGWSIDLQINAPVITTECSLPFPDLTFVDTNCDYTFITEYLTCDTLEDCPIIISLQDQIDIITGGTSSVAWGDITGTLTNQTDLNNALDGKADISGDTFTGLLGANNGFDFSANGGDVTQIVRSGNADLLFSHSGSGDIVISKSGSGTILQDGTEFQEDITVPDEVYGPSWNNSLEVPTKNAIYDKIESLTGGTDVFVTGGTYSSGTAEFTNNTGGTFSVSGFSTGGTSSEDVFVSGGTFDAGAATATFTNNTGGTFTVTGMTIGGGGGGAIFKSVIQGTPSTPAVESIIDTIFIPANTFATGDIIILNSYTDKTASSRPWQEYFYVNSTPVLAGALLIGRFNSANPSFRWNSVIRSWLVRDATNDSIGYASRVNTGFVTTEGANLINKTSYSIDWTVDNYLIMSVISSIGGGIETVTSEGYWLEKK